MWPAMAEDTDADGFAPLRIKRVVRETADAVSLVLDVPEHCSPQFRYQAGQFLTLRVTVDGQDSGAATRCRRRRSRTNCRSPSSAIPAGVVSNWLNDTAAEGAEIHAAPPEGRFVLARRPTDEIVAFAGGSGITPIMSLIRTALASSSRPHPAVLRQPRPRLGDLRRRARHVWPIAHADRLVRRAPLRRRRRCRHACGRSNRSSPAPVTPTLHLRARAVHGRRSRQRCSTSVCRSDAAAPRALRGRPVTGRRRADEPPSVTEEVVIELDRKTTTAAYRAGNTLLQTARIGGPEGAVVMRNRLVRNVYGAGRRGQRPDAEQRCARRRRSRRGLGADLSVPAHQPERSRWSMSERAGNMMERRSMSRVAVVTGGASGMGEATCHELGRRGHKVAVLDLNGDAAQRVAEELRADGVTALGRRGRCHRPTRPSRRRSPRCAPSWGRCTSWSPAQGSSASRRSPRSRRVLAADHRRQPDRHVPLLPGRAARHDRRRAGAAS